jgi:glycerol-3-phosphate O-acyltransferase
MESSSEAVGKTEEYAKRIRPNYGPKFYSSACWVADKLKVPNWLFEKVQLEGLGNIQASSGKQMFYVSNHLSLADFLIQGYTFWKQELPIPRVIAGENLNKFPFGIFWKKCGAIYLDRSLVKNSEYIKIYNEEVKTVLRKGDSLLVYAEGGRNYSGKGVMPLQTGTIGLVSDVVSEGRDIFLAPCYISYDKRIEENVLERVTEYKKSLIQSKIKIEELKKQNKKFLTFVEELRYKRKDKLHFSWDVFAYFERFFSGNKGNVYLNFGKPVSIKNILEDEQSPEFILMNKRIQIERTKENPDFGRINKLILSERIKRELDLLSKERKL